MKFMLEWRSTVTIAFAPYQPTHCLELCFMPILFLHILYAEKNIEVESWEEELSEKVILKSQRQGIKCNEPKRIINIQTKAYVISTLILGLTHNFHFFLKLTIYILSLCTQTFSSLGNSPGCLYKNKSNILITVPRFQKRGKEEIVEVGISASILHYQLDQHSSQPLCLSISSSASLLDQGWRNDTSPWSTAQTYASC